MLNEDPFENIFEGLEEKGSNCTELLNDKEEIETKTELNIFEIISIKNFITIGEILEKKGITNPYKEYCEKHMILKVSKDRKSREEFVTVNTMMPDINTQLSKASNLKNIINAKT